MDDKVKRYLVDISEAILHIEAFTVAIDSLEYDKVDDSVIWGILKKYVPLLKAEVEAVF